MAKPHWLDIVTTDARIRAIASEAVTTEQAQRIAPSLLGRYRSALYAAVLLPTGEYMVITAPDIQPATLAAIAMASGGEYRPDLGLAFLPRPDHTTPLAIYYGVEP